MFNKETSIIKNYFFNDDLVKENGIVVECGTAEGFHEPSKTLENNFNWKFFGFEADPRFFPILCKNRPNATKINAALSDINGKIDFTISAWGGNSSLEHTKIHKEELITYSAKFDDGSYFKKISVPTINWNHFIKLYNIKNIDLFILDVEGQEIKILNGMTRESVLPQVIQIEFAYSDCENILLDEEKKENFSGIFKISKKLFELNYQFDYVNFNNAFFSQKSFWNNKQIPDIWEGEDEEFHWRGICYYNKSKFKKLIEYIK
jgi:FkbM family methyltransferase